MSKKAFNKKYNGKLTEVVNIYYADKEDRNSDYLTGLVIELADGRVFEHAQDGFVVAFNEMKEQSNE